jgi:hypothetical protein
MVGVHQVTDEPMRRPLPRWVLPALLFLLAAALRFYHAGVTPLHPDEIHYAYDFMERAETSSFSAIRDLQCAMQAERRTAHPMVVQLLTRLLWYLPFGWMVDATPLFLRTFNILVGAAAVLIAWWIGRTVEDGKHGLVAAGLVAICPGLVWVSRTLYLDPVFTAMIGMMILCAAKSMRKGGYRWPALQGVFFALALGSKISGPILAPALLAGLLLAPAGTPWVLRLKRVGVGCGVALFVALLLFNPFAYLRAIVDPSDVRYEHAWEDGGAPSFFNMLMVYATPYFQLILWDLPLTAFFGALTVAVGSIRRRLVFPLYLTFFLLCLTPLLFMHLPKFSGPHGFMPIYLLVSLIAMYLASMPAKALAGFLVAHSLLSVTSITLRAKEIPFLIDPSLYYLHRDPRYELVKPWVHQRNPSMRIVLLLDPMEQMGWVNTMRNAQLSEGAIFYLSRPMGSPNADLWQWADVVVMKTSQEETLPAPDSFTEQARTENEVIYVRTKGTARTEIAVQEMEVYERAGQTLRVFPGGVYPVTGTVALDGAVFPVDGNRFSGRADAYRWGSGVFLLQENAEEKSVTIEAPRRADVFWDF